MTSAVVSPVKIARYRTGQNMLRIRPAEPHRRGRMPEKSSITGRPSRHIMDALLLISRGVIGLRVTRVVLDPSAGSFGRLLRLLKDANARVSAMWGRCAFGLGRWSAVGVTGAAAPVRFDRGYSPVMSRHRDHDEDGGHQERGGADRQRPHGPPGGGGKPTGEKQGAANRESDPPA